MVKGAGVVVRFVRVVAAAAMSCFFGCLRIKDSRSHMSALKRPMSHDKESLTSLLLSDDDSLRNRGKARKPQPEEADIGELKYEAMFLKACGTLPETPLEIRKASRNWVTEKEESLNFNSWLPTEKLKLEKQPDQSPPHVKYCEASCLMNTPSRKRVSGTLAVEFNETEVPDMASSQVQSSAHIKSVVSF